MFVVVVANVIPNVTNAMDLQRFPSNLHIHLHQNANDFHPLEPLCHVPPQLPPSAPLTESLMEMSSVVSL